MHLGSLLRRGAATGSAIALLLVGAPQAFAQQASAPPAVGAPVTQIKISDTGFDAPSYTAFAPTAGNEPGKVIFTNVGTTVHTATVVPGTSGYGWNFSYATNAAGQVTSACWIAAKLGVPGCTRIGTLDTGGIDPGASVVMGVVWGQVQQPGGPPVQTSFQVTSATDCLNGSTSSSFNCTPVTINTKQRPPNPALGPTTGSLLAPLGDPACVKSIISSAGLPFCFTGTAFRNTAVKGSVAAPLTGTVPVSITEYNGFQPSNVTVAGGTTLIFTNNSSRVHSIFFGGPGNNSGGGQVYQPGGIGPGETYTMNAGCNATINANNPCSWFATLASTTDEDKYPAEDTAVTGVGVSRPNSMQMYLYVVPPSS